MSWRCLYSLFEVMVLSDLIRARGWVAQDFIKAYSSHAAPTWSLSIHPVSLTDEVKLAEGDRHHCP